MTPTNDIVENKADDSPRDVVDSTGGWDRARAAENDGEVDKFEVGVVPFSAD